MKLNDPKWYRPVDYTSQNLSKPEWNCSPAEHEQCQQVLPLLLKTEINLSHRSLSAPVFGGKGCTRQKTHVLENIVPGI